MHIQHAATALAAAATSIASADQAAALLEGPPTVHPIAIEFAEADWYQILFDAYGNDDYYLPCTFTWTDGDGVHQTLEQVGARFKGNSSFLHSGTRKSLKIDFNEFIDTQEFLGLKKLNLNNNFRDPSIMREKLLLDFLGDHMDIHRANYARVTINGEDWGVFMAVEQVDKTFCEKRWGSDDDGNLYKGEFTANLAYQGDNPDDYRDNYEKKTNETEDDWTDLIALCQFLTDTDPADMDTQLGNWIDIDQHLTALAASAIFSSYDSYVGPAHNFYVYRRNTDGLWRHVNWDNNAAFGNFRNVIPDGQNILTVPLTFTREGGGPNAARPFADAVFDNDVLLRQYLRRCAELLRAGFDEAAFQARIDTIDGAVRSELLTDPYFEYTIEEYDQNLHSSVNIGSFDAFGLTELVSLRGDFARSELDAAALSSDVQLNEVQTDNATTLADEAGDFDPWIEVHNLGPGSVSLGTLYLSGDPGTPMMWQLPDVTLADGDFAVITTPVSPCQPPEVRSCCSIQPAHSSTALSCLRSIRTYRGAGSTMKASGTSPAAPHRAAPTSLHRPISAASSSSTSSWPTTAPHSQMRQTSTTTGSNSSMRRARMSTSPAAPCPTQWTHRTSGPSPMERPLRRGTGSCCGPTKTLIRGRSTPTSNSALGATRSDCGLPTAS